MDVEVRFEPTGRSIRVPRGTRILDAARRAGLPLADPCGANGTCARCGVLVLAGSEWVSAETADEASAKRYNRIDPSQRLACLATVSGDVRITATYW